LIVEAEPIVFDERSFHALIAIERKRTDRSRRPFLLVLLDPGDSLPAARQEAAFASMATSLSALAGDSDVIGWYQANHILGVIFTEITPENSKRVLTSTMARVGGALRDALRVEQFSELQMTAHFYPEAWEHELNRRPSNPALYPDISLRNESRKLQKIVKRGIDIAGSVAGLVVLFPVFALIALAIKITSKGPVLFRQQRVGEYGRPFIFLKFRSMRVNNDEGVHKQWFRDYLGGRTAHRTADGSTIVKLTNDPRVTSVGRFLRRTSLDELPQFVNVLKGEMSLVGPRPPIPYEVEAYQSWHRGRVLEAKPGITGLWQVMGRSRVSFDEMVRLDLQYARTWSLWLDIKILLKTPRAVLFGEGAY
jgi:exopolysaccharide biosynthesis polyprenyl glycosylphosphotransferase